MSGWICVFPIIRQSLTSSSSFNIYQNKNCSGAQQSWHLEVCSLNEPWTRNVRLYWSCLCSSSHYSFFFLTHSFLLPTVSDISNQAPLKILLSLLHHFSILTSAHILPNMWSRCLLLISLPEQHRDEWLHSRGCSVFNFPAQRIHSSDLTLRQGGWLEPCHASVVWGPAASASPGSLLGMQNLSAHSRPADWASAYLHFSKAPKGVLSLH